MPARKTISPCVLQPDQTEKISVKRGEDRPLFFLIEDAGQKELELNLADGASCDVVLLSSSEGNSTFQGRSTLATNARIHWHVITLGKGSVTQDIQSEIHGGNAESSIDWIFYATDTDKYSLNARNVFSGRDGGGEITMRGVAEGKAHVKALGNIEISAGGTGTNTYLTQNVLMLDASAKVDAIPRLEIHTNDVKASHSASIARVTPEDLFYFAARGIEEAAARQMFVRGFLGDLVQKISDSEIRERVLSELERKFAPYIVLH